MSDIKETRNTTGTEYKLSANSNPGSRRSSLGGVGHDIYLSGNGSMRNSSQISIGEQNDEFNMLQKYLGPQLTDLHDSVLTLESNFDRLNNIHNNLVDLNESFGSLLYGIICTSSCLLFPGIPNDVQEQMSTINKLKQLDTERNSLLQEISDIKNFNKNKITPIEPSGNTLVNKFSKPLFTVDNTKRMKQTHQTMNQGRSLPNRSKQPVNRPLKSMNTFDTSAKNDNSDDIENDDDNSSEASFVMNPANANNQQDIIHDENVDRRYRRRSILNVIRNSNPSTHLLRPQYMGKGNSQHTVNRYSLGGRARRVTHGSTLMTAPTRTNQLQTNSTVNRLSRTKPSTKPKAVGKRPPFR